MVNFEDMDSFEKIDYVSLNTFNCIGITDVELVFNGECSPLLKSLMYVSYDKYTILYDAHRCLEMLKSNLTRPALMKEPRRIKRELLKKCKDNGIEYVMGPESGDDFNSDKSLGEMVSDLYNRLDEAFYKMKKSSDKEQKKLEREIKKKEKDEKKRKKEDESENMSSKRSKLN